MKASLWRTATRMPKISIMTARTEPRVGVDARGNVVVTSLPPNGNSKNTAPNGSAASPATSSRASARGDSLSGGKTGCRS